MDRSSILIGGIGAEMCDSPQPAAIIMSSRALRLCVLIIVAMAAIVSPSQGKKSGNTKSPHIVTAQTASFGPLGPGKSGMAAAVLVPFSLSIPEASVANGYHIRAVSSFAFSPTAPSAGGKSLTAADIGVGIIGMSSLLGANANGYMAMSPGFNYDPAVSRGGSGTNPYPGAARGRANLADLLGGQDIVQVGPVLTRDIPADGDQLTLSVKIAVPTQFFTPGGFSGTITLIVLQ